PNEWFMQQGDDAAVPRGVKVSSCEQCASRVVHAVQGTTEVLLFDEEIGFLECPMRACYPMLSKRVGGVHNGMLSRATFLMKGVPATRRQILLAGFFGCELTLKLSQILRKRRARHAPTL